jgi:hypothetical protein
MIEKLIGYGFHEEDVEDLKKWYDGTNEELGSNVLTLTQKWSIVFKINGCGKYSKEDAKKYYDELFEKDESDTKLNYKLMIEALNADEDQRKVLLAEYFNADTKWSYVELENSTSGFTSKFVPFEAKEKYFD